MGCPANPQTLHIYFKAAVVRVLFVTFNPFSLILLFPEGTTQYNLYFHLTVFFDSKGVIEIKTKAAHPMSN